MKVRGKARQKKIQSQVKTRQKRRRRRKKIRFSKLNNRKWVFGETATLFRDYRFEL